MKIKSRLFLGFMTMGIFIGVMGIISIFELGQTEVYLDSLRYDISNLEKSQKLLSHAANIKYYDEVLTQSARNYAFTGNEVWRERYFETEPILTDELSVMLESGNNIERDFFNEVDTANTKLVGMELESIRSVQDNDLERAVSILKSQEYLDNKKIYTQGLSKYIESRNLEHGNLMKESTSDIDSSLNIVSDHVLLGIAVLAVSIFGIVGGSLIFGFYISRSILKPITELEEVSKQIISGNLDVKSVSDSKDEIGNLSRTFESMIKSLKDMTDIEAQMSLQQNLRTALDESSIVSIIDPNGKITYVNDKFCEVSKYSKEELIGQRQDSLRSTKIHSPSFYADLWKTISSGKIWHGEICNTAKDGALFWNDTTVIPFLRKDGKISEYVSVRINITEQKNLTQKLIHAERFSAIGELSSRISHDMRNPLAIIINEFDLLKRKNTLTEKQSNRISSAVNRITHQLDDVLDYLRDTPLEYAKFNLSDLLSQVISSLDVPSEVEIKTSDSEIFMVGDENKINIVLTNLIFNSIQTLEEKGKIEITLSKTGAEVIIKVQDSGEGISIKPIEKVFDPLVTSKQKGTGLGLASVKNIVNQHDGEITVRNNPTTFTIKIPQTEEEE